MRIKKTLVVVCLTVLLTIMMSFNAFAESSDPSQAGVKLVMEGQAIDGIMTMKVQMKLPDGSQGVTSFANIISYDSSVLTLVEYDDTATTVTADGNTVDTTTYTSPIIDVRLTDTNSTEYGVFDATLSTASNRTTLKTTLMTQITGATVENPNSGQNTTSWQDVYSFKFKIAGNGNPKEVLDENSIRFFNATTDSANLDAADLNWTTFFDLMSTGEQFVNHWTGSGSAPVGSLEMETVGSGSVSYTNKDATGVTVSGAISSYNPNNTIDIKLMQGNTEIKSAQISATSGSGVVNSTFEILDVEPGTYDLVIEKAGHIDYSITGITVEFEALDLTTNTNTNISNIKMLAGDMNNDNACNPGDIGIFLSQYQKTLTIEVADINGDGFCNPGDIGLFLAAYQKQTVFPFS